MSACKFAFGHVNGAALSARAACSICEQLKHFAKRGGFRTVDLRSAVRSGHIDSSHLLSEECFAQVMKAYVRGDTGASERKTLQAGARAERMHKRNRV